MEKVAAGEWMSSLNCSLSPNKEFSQRVYVIAGPILLTLGLCGNFGILAMLSKHRFKHFPIVTLIKSHAVTNIFCLFIGLFIGDYFRALTGANKDIFQNQWSCCVHLTLVYAFKYVTAWHFVVTSCIRVLMVASPSYFTSRKTRTLVRVGLSVILFLGLLLSAHIFWSIAFQSPENNIKTKSKLKNDSSTTVKECDFVCEVQETNESSVFSWKMIDLAAGTFIPLAIVFANSTAASLLRYRSSHSMTAISSINVVSYAPDFCDFRLRRRRSSAVEVVAKNLANMLFFQDVSFIVLMSLLLVYFSMLYFPPKPLVTTFATTSPLGKVLELIYPFANLLQYSTKIIQFPVFTLCNSCLCARRSARSHTVTTRPQAPSRRRHATGAEGARQLTDGAQWTSEEGQSSPLQQPDTLSTSASADTPTNVTAGQACSEAEKD